MERRVTATLYLVRKNTNLAHPLSIFREKKVDAILLIEITISLGWIVAPRVIWITLKELLIGPLT